MVLPTCPVNYFLNKKTCRCNKTVKKPAAKKAPVEKPAAKKAPVEKPAAKKAPVEKPAAKKATAKKPAAKKATAKKPAVKKLSRCPNGTRKNKKTGKCEKTAKIEKNIPKKEILKIKSDSSQPNLAVSEAFRTIPPDMLNKLLENFRKGSSKNTEGLLSTVRSQLVKSNSFSPAINKQLISLHPRKS